MAFQSIRKALQRVLAMAILATGAVALAQEYPTRTVTLVVPFTPGTAPDVLARELAPILQRKLNRTVVVDNKPGAGTMIASKFVADAAPDGHTLFLNGSSSALAPEMNPATKGRNYVREMAYVSPIAVFPNTIVISGELPVRTLAELLAYLKANPGKVSYGSPGIGSSPHLQTEWFKQLSGTEMTHIPYKSYDALYSDMVGGRVHMTIAAFGSVKTYLESGKLRLLAVTMPTRVAGLDYPTASEAGVPGFSVVPWVGISAPKGTPPAIVAMLDRYIQEAIEEPVVLARLKFLGLEPMPGNAAQLRDFVERDIDRWVKVIRDAGIKIE